MFGVPEVTSELCRYSYVLSHVAPWDHYMPSHDIWTRSKRWRSCVACNKTFDGYTLNEEYIFIVGALLRFDAAIRVLVRKNSSENSDGCVVLIHVSLGMMRK